MKNLSKLVSELSPKLNKGEYVFVTVNDINTINRNDSICEFKEKEGTTIILERTKADQLKLNYSFVSAWITLNVHSALDAVGLTAIVANELTKNRISCNVVAGYYHDHIFVDKDTADKAINVLIELSNNFKENEIE